MKAKIILIISLMIVIIGQSFAQNSPVQDFFRLYNKTKKKINSAHDTVMYRERHECHFVIWNGSQAKEEIEIRWHGIEKYDDSTVCFKGNGSNSYVTIEYTIYGFKPFYYVEKKYFFLASNTIEGYFKSDEEGNLFVFGENASELKTGSEKTFFKNVLKAFFSANYNDW